MKRKTYALLFNILLVLLVLLQLNLIYGDDNSHMAANNVTNITITKYHTKSTKAADLAQVQLQDVLVAAEKNKLADGDSVNKTETTRRRKITPTDNQDPIKKVMQTVLQSAKAIGNNETKDPPANKGQLVAAAAEEKNRNVTFVAENVALNITNDIPKKTEVNKTTIINATSLQNKSTQAPPVTPATMVTVKVNATSLSSTAAAAAAASAASVNSNISIAVNNNTNSSSSTSVTSTTSTTTTTTTTTTTASTTTTTTSTTTTTPKPKKPLITYSVEDFPDLDANVLKQSSQIKKSTSKLPSSDTDTEHEAPHAQPSQEHISAFPYRNNRDYIVPIVAIMFAVPITMGIVITAYRRIRDFWSTRHYRRMDFLVDGMYND